MKRLIDADVLEKRIYDWSKATGCEIFTKYHFFEFIEHTPDVDAVEVVRCKDCKHRRNDEDFVSGHYCALRPSNGGRFCEDEDFCSYGERREDG